MSVPSVAFNPCYDIHLLRGQVIKIVDEEDEYSLLELNEEPVFDYITDHPEIRCSFRFSFEEADAATFAIEITRSNFSDPDLSYLVITLLDGEPADPKNRIRNFYLFAKVEDDEEEIEISLRIHIHNKMEEVWITPNPITVYNRVDCSPYLRARYDDQVVAEIGTVFRGDNGDEVLYHIEPRPAIRWSSPTTDLIDEDDGTISATNQTGTHRITVSVRWGQTFENQAEVIFSENLTESSPLRAEPVATSQGPGLKGLETATNILFLSDGFTDEQEYDFKIFVLEYVSDLVNKKITSPFDLLKKSINFWMVFVPSRQSGATYRGELCVEKRTKPNSFEEIFGVEFDEPIDPGNRDVSEWTIRNLFYKVGLPVRAEGDPNDAAVFSQIIEKWRETTLLTSGQLDHLETDKTLVREWQRYADRRLPDAVDTAFGITVNNHTAAEHDGDFNRINFDGKRIQRGDLDRFFRNLRTRAEPSNPETRIGPRFILDDNENPGRDWDNVVILTAAQQGTAQNINGNMFAQVVELDQLIMAGKLTDLRMSVAPTEMPLQMSNALKATLTHELCHSFGLGDEYATSPPKKFNKKPVDDITWDFAIYPSQPSVLDIYANLQAKKDLRKNPSNANSAIDALKIKWRYHRIQKCGLVSTIAVNQNTISLTLQDQVQLSRFSAGTTVFLRKRQRRKDIYLLVSSTDVNPFVENTIVHPTWISSRFFGRAQITAVDVPNDQVTIRSARTSTTLTVTLQPGSVNALSVGQTVFIETQSTNPVHTIFRTDPNDFTRAVSPLLTVTDVNMGDQTMTLSVPSDETLIDYLQTIDEREVMIVYKPVELPADERTPEYSHAELIAKPVLFHLKDNPFPFNSDDQNREIVVEGSNTRIPSQLVPCCSRNKKQIVGLYSGGKKYHGSIYHPTPFCLMRHQYVGEKYTELCAVCRYTLVNLIDPNRFGAFDDDYMSRKIYPS
ncbi:hypothetical protein [Larkinella rosea]|uniref:Uncharacterized protein n=1 Tax=Larkinella rosea TaxID=2025312 RepID=A0A3P1C1U3_9BACT|nr:hypothetical protein [Larkinella rosea]RRB07228.1 hypothetical protein EHT25_05470 [Larkinella rosea]